MKRSIALLFASGLALNPVSSLAINDLYTMSQALATVMVLNSQIQEAIVKFHRPGTPGAGPTPCSTRMKIS